MKSLVLLVTFALSASAFPWFKKEVPVRFMLLTNENQDHFEELLQTPESIESSNYNPSIPTKFLIHGFTNSYETEWICVIAQAWFKHGQYNIIVVDWARARTFNYFDSVDAVADVGVQTAAFIDFLNEQYGLDFNTLELIGHSLGAHVAGYTGKNVKNGQINTIVGLDPAQLLFDAKTPTLRLCESDAEHVTAIHTSAGAVGFLVPVGTADFYVNGGSKQPGCGFNMSCDHGKALEYYTLAVLSGGITGIECASYKDAVNSHCTSDKISVIGTDLSQNVQNGVYLVSLTD